MGKLFSSLVLIFALIVCSAPAFETQEFTVGQTQQAGKASEFSTGTPKEHFKQAESLVKRGKLYDAFEEYLKAANGEPNNKKYQEKLIALGKQVSSDALSVGINEINTAPDVALLWFQRALRYDSSNQTAAKMLAQLRDNIATALATSRRAQSALDAGDSEAARKLVNSIQVYAKVIPEIVSLQTELNAADSALRAQRLWEKRDKDGALEELRKAESIAWKSKFVARISDGVRQEIANELLTKVSTLPEDSIKQLFDKLLLTRSVLRIDPENIKAKATEKQVSEALIKSTIERNELLIKSGKSPGNARIVLERLKITLPLVDANTKLSEQMASAETLAYPRFRVRVTVDEREKCKAGPTLEEITNALNDALKPVAQVDDKNWDLKFDVKDLSCTSTDIPKQSVEQVNSTYIAGYTQLSNPEYAKLQEDLQAAQTALSRAVYENSVNPNFGTGFALGMAQGRVRNIQKQMSKTEPFINQPINQQYKYERFAAYRAFQVAARLQISARDQEYVSEKEITGIGERRGVGISGILPSDSTGLSNSEPSLPSLDAVSREGLTKFHEALGNSARDLITGLLASTVMNQKLSSIEKFGAMLYLVDLSERTLYEKEASEIRINIPNALFAGDSAIDSLLASISLPLPDRLVPADRAEESSATSLEKTLEGVVAIETDVGVEGSGFFLTPGCLIVTNAHVVEGAETIIAKTASRRLFTAQVIAKDNGRDLAILRSNARQCSPLLLEDTSKASIGQEVYAIGNPLGFSGTVTRGIIGAMRKDDNGIQYIQLDASVNPGNSGGPLVGRNGKVLGVNTFKVRGSVGLNFALASDEIKNAFGQLLH